MEDIKLESLQKCPNGGNCQINARLLCSTQCPFKVGVTTTQKCAAGYTYLGANKKFDIKVERSKGLLLNPSVRPDVLSTEPLQSRLRYYAHIFFRLNIRKESDIKV